MPQQSIKTSKSFNLWLSTIATLVAVTSATGCNLCCPPYMDDYATIGGKWQRSHPSEGTVGSAFSDPNLGSLNTEQASYSGTYLDEGTSLHGTDEWMPYDQEIQSSDVSQPGVTTQGEPDNSIILLDE